jgi:hypothetical protein
MDPPGPDPQHKVIFHKLKLAVYSLLVYREASPESSEADRRGGQTLNKPS